MISGINHLTWSVFDIEESYFLDPSDNKFELHYSGLEARIKDGKANRDPGVTWYR